MPLLLLFAVSNPPTIPIGALYIPNYHNIPWTQPGGVGTTVFPQQNTSPFGYPIPGVNMQEPGQGLWTAGCGHWFDEFVVFRDFDNTNHSSMAVQCCPLCTFIRNIIEPYEQIDNIIKYPILV